VLGGGVDAAALRVSPRPAAPNRLNMNVMPYDFLHSAYWEGGREVWGRGGGGGVGPAP